MAPQHIPLQKKKKKSLMLFDRLLSVLILNQLEPLSIHHEPLTIISLSSSIIHQPSILYEMVRWYVYLFLSHSDINLS